MSDTESETTSTQKFETGMHHVAFRVVDFDRAMEFFVEGLGFESKYTWTNKKGHRCAILGCGNGCNVEIFGSGEEEDDYSNPALYHFALRTNDIESDHKRALDAGATERMPPTVHNIPMDGGARDVKISFVDSPVGVVIEFFQNGYAD